MMRIWCLCILLSGLIWAQEEGKESKETAKKQESAEISLAHAEEELRKERLELAKREERLAQLLEELKNNVDVADAKERASLDQLNQLKQEKEDWALQKQQEADRVEVPDELINYYQSRDPQIAAQDFMLLFEQEEIVAVALVKNMKKKKSAKLMDEVAKTGQNGKDIAAKIAAAIGSENK